MPMDADVSGEQPGNNPHLTAKLDNMKGQMENLRGFLKGVGTWVIIKRQFCRFTYGL